MYEKETATFVGELHKQITGLQSRKLENDVKQRPVGVTIILNNSENFVRHGFAPLAAAIAAGNVVILTSSLHSNSTIISRLQDIWANYLDTDSVLIHYLEDISSIDVGTIDQISLLGGSAITTSLTAILIN